MLPDIKLEDIIDDWKDEYGTRARSKAHGTEYLAIPKGNRKNLFYHLVATLKEKGAEREYFRMDRVGRAIAGACFAPEDCTLDKASRRKGMETAMRELREVVSSVYRTDGDVLRVAVPSGKEYDPKNAKPEDALSNNQRNDGLKSTTVIDTDFSFLERDDE